MPAIAPITASLISQSSTWVAAVLIGTPSCTTDLVNSTTGGVNRARPRRTPAPMPCHPAATMGPATSAAVARLRSTSTMICAGPTLSAVASEESVAAGQPERRRRRRN